MRSIRASSRIALLGVVLLLCIFLLLAASPFSKHVGGTAVLSSVVRKFREGNMKLRESIISGSSGDRKEMALREWEFRRAVQYEGTGARIQNFLDKARAGQPFTISVIGGSVSKGRGLIPGPEESRYSRRQLDLDTDLQRKDEAEISQTASQTDDTRSNESGTTFTGKFGADTLYSPENLHVLIFDWLNSTFPHPDNKLVNGAQGGVGSGYFSWCFKEHIAVESDLVLIELGINDLIEVDVLGAYEHLMRAVLELPNTPAVINIETFTTLFPTLLSSSALHLDVAAFYDIPSLSIRDVLLPRLLSDPDTQMPRWFRTGSGVKMGDKKVRMWGGVPVDLMHISALGHALAAGLVIRYLSEEIEKTRHLQSPKIGKLSSTALRNADLRILNVPAGALTMPFDPDTGLIQYDPTCRSLASPVYHPDENGKPFRGIPTTDQGSGWTLWAWEEKVYLVATEPGSLLSIPFTIVEPEFSDLSLQDLEDGVDDQSDSQEGRIGFAPLPLAVRPSDPEDSQRIGIVIEPMARRDRPQSRQYPEVEEASDGARVMIAFQKSATLGLGSVYCWIDELKSQGTRVEGWWDIEERNMGVVEEVASGLQPGKHTLHCELSEHTLDPNGGTEFRIFAVMYD